MVTKALSKISTSIIVVNHWKNSGREIVIDGFAFLFQRPINGFNRREKAKCQRAALLSVSLRMDRKLWSSVGWSNTGNIRVISGNWTQWCGNGGNWNLAHPEQRRCHVLDLVSSAIRCSIFLYSEHRLGHTLTYAEGKYYLFGGLANDSKDPKQNVPR